MSRVTFLIGDMHCEGCEGALKSAVGAVSGVRSVRADYRTKKLEVIYVPPCTQEGIVSAIIRAGYHVSVSGKEKRGWVMVALIIGLALLLKATGAGSVFSSLPRMAEAGAGYGALFVLGLLTSVHCIAMCGGIHLSQVMTGDGTVSFARSLQYNVGRLAGYTLVGAILGFFGGLISVTLQTRAVIGLAAGIFMLFMGFSMLTGVTLPGSVHVRFPGFLFRIAVFLRKKGPFAVGMANALMPCGPLQSMQLLAIASGGMLKGALSMGIFCLGTIPLVSACALAANLAAAKWREKLLSAGAAVLVVMGFMMLSNNLALMGIGGQRAEPEEETMVSVQDEVQYITTELRPNGYSDLSLKAGVAAVWTISADKEALNGCNNALVIPQLGIQVQLTEGENTIFLDPLQEGTYIYTCWMGMLKNTIVVSEEG